MERSRLTVGDVMARDVVTIGADAPLGDAMRLMRRRGISHLPVVDRAGHLAGIVSDRDAGYVAVAPAFRDHLSPGAEWRLPGLRRRFRSLRVRDAMTRHPVVVHPATPLGHAVAIMFENRFRCLPVTQDDRIVGIVTEREALGALSRLLPEVRRGR
jgi:acetoin utilization protein AcuB